ncbi:hypothetical protein shim_20820 [Shimia sp. SK013]|uniref:hypothetical protein n=1 Tax=Shimia sp. SK013 TaxID=1389006 RepID=UPI0006B3FC70|nr:hypothetical protein [Shimia sp. SK013]KPA21378.1 hypothetical protein shim_20820 [Shimia sp. SK013]
MYVITLSAIPPRFSSMQVTLELLLAQRTKPEAVILYIPRAYDRFPEWDGTLPEVPKGVEIRQVEADLGPATKVLPALREFAGQDMNILFCDDDIHYRDTWARGFLNAAKRHPGCCIALAGQQVGKFHENAVPSVHMPRAVRQWVITDVEFHLRNRIERFHADRAGARFHRVGRRIYLRGGYADVLQGYAGVMVRPEFFAPEVFNVPVEARNVDDIWLSGMLAKAGTPIWVPGLMREPDVLISGHQSDALHQTDVDGLGRNAQNRRAIGYLRDTFGVWR